MKLKYLLLIDLALDIIYSLCLLFIFYLYSSFSSDYSSNLITFSQIVLDILLVRMAVNLFSCLCSCAESYVNGEVSIGFFNLKHWRLGLADYIWTLRLPKFTVLCFVLERECDKTGSKWLFSIYYRRKFYKFISIFPKIHRD